MSRVTQVTFLVHMVVALVAGALLLVIPGSTLEWIGWVLRDPATGQVLVDPASGRPLLDAIMARMLGAALVGLAWSSFRGWRAREWKSVAILVEAEAAFSLLACAGLLRHLLFAHYPIQIWVLLGVMAAFALAWIAAWLRK